MQVRSHNLHDGAASLYEADTRPAARTLGELDRLNTLRIAAAFARRVKRNSWDVLIRRIFEEHEGCMKL
jgi:hypothetical protein